MNDHELEIKTIKKNLDNIRHCAHPKCIVCSPDNPRGLHLVFDVDDDGGVEATFHCDESFEGYPGILHGGIISLIMDAAMGQCIFARGQTGVTIEMKTRFPAPVLTGHEAKVLAKITQYSEPVYFLEAKIIQNEKVKATAKARFYEQPKLINTDTD